MEIAPELVVPNPKLSIREGAIAPWATSVERGDGWTFRTIEALAKATGVDLDVPFSKLAEKAARTGALRRRGQEDSRDLGQ